MAPYISEFMLKNLTRLSCGFLRIIRGSYIHRLQLGSVFHCSNIVKMLYYSNVHLRYLFKDLLSLIYTRDLPLTSYTLIVNIWYI